MARQLARLLSGLCLCLVIASASAANLVVYDDQSENGFDQGCSFPSPSADFDFANAAPNPVHIGTHSVRFTPDHFNLLSWCTPATYSATTDYTGIDFWVNGGTTGSQNVNLVLGLAGNPVAQASLTALQGIPLGANLWVHFQLTFSNPGGLNYAGQFDQISFQEESNAVQADMYFDDVTLIAPAAAASGQNYIFGDSFEPEYMLVPQYTGHSIKVYQRTTNTTTFTAAIPVNVASLGASVTPNSVAFAPDGNVWVVDTADPNYGGNSRRRLLRYTLASLLSNANPPAAVTVIDVGANAGDIFDIAFFGDYAYVSQSNFGGTNQILKFSIANLNAASNLSTPLSDVNHPLNVPAGLAFDAQGRLWITNYSNGGNPTIMRMNTSTGSIDKVGTSVAVGARASLSNPEGIAFDPYGSLWIGNNGEPTVSVYADSQLNNAAFGATIPVYQIDIAPGQPVGGDTVGFVGGIVMDRRGDLRGNYEHDAWVVGYSFNTTIPPTSSSYTSTSLTTLTSATTNPGRGGIAIWPRPNTLHIN